MAAGLLYYSFIEHYSYTLLFVAAIAAGASSRESRTAREEALVGAVACVLGGPRELLLVEHEAGGA